MLLKCAELSLLCVSTLRQRGGLRLRWGRGVV